MTVRTKLSQLVEEIIDELRNYAPEIGIGIIVVVGVVVLSLLDKL